MSQYISSNSQLSQLGIMSKINSDLQRVPQIWFVLEKFFFPFFWYCSMCYFLSFSEIKGFKWICIYFSIKAFQIKKATPGAFIYLSCTIPLVSHSYKSSLVEFAFYSQISVMSYAIQTVLLSYMFAHKSSQSQLQICSTPFCVMHVEKGVEHKYVHFYFQFFSL